MPWGKSSGTTLTGNQVISSKTTLGDLAKLNRKDYGFKRFWEGRPELSGGNPWDYNWLTPDRPKIKEGYGPMKGYRGGRGFQEPEKKDYGPPDEDHDISGIAAGPFPMPKQPKAGYRQPGTEFSDLEPFGGHHLRNVRVGQMAGEEIGGRGPALGTGGPTMPGMTVSPFEGHRLRNVRTGAMAGEEIGTQRALGPGPRGVGTQGALPRGSQFTGVAGVPRRLALPPAGGSSYTYTTNKRGQMGWDF